MSKKTLVIGASTNPVRYSYKAVMDLQKHGHDIIAYGRRPGKIGSVPIVTEIPEGEKIDTITVYISKENQGELLDIIEKVSPERVIFNPGAENYDLIPHITSLGIESIEACTLVMLSIGDY